MPNDAPNPALDTRRLRHLDPDGVASELRDVAPSAAAEALVHLTHGQVAEVMERLPEAQRAAISALGVAGLPDAGGLDFPDGSVGRLVERAPAVFGPELRVDAAIEALRGIVAKRMVIYVFVVDAGQRLQGVVAFRELVFARPEQTLGEIMLRQPFFLRPTMTLEDAMREVVTRHYPVYPVCTDDGRLIGLVAGAVLFEQQAFEISAQAGAMVGVEREERLATPLLRSFRFRHPWLLINLLTVFVAAGVVGLFEKSIDQLVVLALFLPVLAGQCGNLGAQSLAVTLRAMTLGETRQIRVLRLALKEAGLGLLNGVLTGLLAGAAMYWLAGRDASNTGDPLLLAAVTVIAMSIGCALSGVAGAMAPLLLKRAGADPATASAILLSTATDVLSMGLFLGLATYVVL
jgi:magnesium transporter